MKLQWQGQGAWQSNEFALQHDLHAIVTGLSTIASELSGLPSVSIQSKMDVQGKQDDSGLHLRATGKTRTPLRVPFRSPSTVLTGRHIFPHSCIH